MNILIFTVFVLCIIMFGILYYGIDVLLQNQKIIVDEIKEIKRQLRDRKW